MKIYHQTQKVRCTNMELLRIVAMILVLIVHANFHSIGAPTIQEMETDTAGSIIRLIVQGLSSICVNVFVLLSGWFGINFKLSRLAEFLFQVLFFAFLGVAIAAFCQHVNLISALGSGLFMLSDKTYWFVKAYLMLYFISPILNSYSRTASREQYKCVLILFFLFETIYGFGAGVKWFNEGYSTMSFIGLYLLARYCKIYPSRLTFSTKYMDVGICFLALLLTTLIVFITYLFNIQHHFLGRCFNYDSPLVIITSLYFLLFFSKIKIPYNKVINNIAISCFAVYLVHANPYVLRTYYSATIRCWFEECGGIEFLLRTSAFLIFFFFTSILLDKVRIYFWRWIKFSIYKTNDNG